MKHRSLSLVLGFALACAASAPACAQQPPGGAGDVQKQLDALRDQVRVMQKDLDEIKALLAPLRPKQPAENLTLDLGKRPVKGEPTARLTLVELTDYQ